jgi:hypothetical protein
MVVIATSFNATAFATNQSTDKTKATNNQTNTLIKKEDGHILTQKRTKNTNNTQTSFYHYNEIKDTNTSQYQNTPKQERHYHNVSTNSITVDGKATTTKTVTVYNINKNKTVCNIVVHAKNSTSKEADCSNITKAETPKKENCKDEKKTDNPKVVSDTNRDNQQIKKDDLKPNLSETKNEPTAPVKVASATIETPKVTQQPQTTPEQYKGQNTPQSLPVTGASGISGTILALIVAVVTFVGYTSSLAVIEYRMRR